METIQIQIQTITFTRTQPYECAQTPYPYEHHLKAGLADIRLMDTVLITTKRM